MSEASYNEDDVEWPINVNLLNNEVHGDQIKALFARYQSLQKHIISGHEKFMESVRDFPDCLEIRFIMLDCVEDVSSAMIRTLMQKYNGSFFHCLPLNKKLISPDDGSSYEYGGQKIVPIPPHCANPAALEALLRDSMNMTVEHNDNCIKFGLSPVFSLPLEILMEATKEDRQALIKVILELDFLDVSNFATIRGAYRNDPWLMKAIWEAELCGRPEYNGKILVRFLNNILRDSTFLQGETLETFFNLNIFTQGPLDQNVDHFLTLPTNMQKLMNLTSALMIKNVPYHKKEHLRLIVKNIGVALNVEMEVGDVVSAARQHTEYQKPGSPSNVLAMFREQSLRDAFLLQYLNYNKKLLGTDVGIVSASEIYVDECLPTTTLTKIHKAVIQKKKHPKDEEIKVFSFHGEIFIKSNDMEAQIKNSLDCKEFLDSLD